MSKGSRSTFSGYPRVCAGCGNPVRITGSAPLMFLSTAPDWRPQSWHAGCRLALRPREVEAVEK